MEVEDDFTTSKPVAKAVEKFLLSKHHDEAIRQQSAPSRFEEISHGNDN
jgi:hypothetical protein